MNEMTRTRLTFARKLALEGQYRDARQVLKRVDHPIAEKWLRQIDRRVEAEMRHPSSNVDVKKMLRDFAVIALIAIVLFVVVYVIITQNQYQMLKDAGYYRSFP